MEHAFNVYQIFIVIKPQHYLIVQYLNNYFSKVLVDSALLVLITYIALFMQINHNVIKIVIHST